MIIPAILENNFKAVAGKIFKYEGTAPWIHLDVGDGLLTPELTWSTPADLADLPGVAKLEAHLMIKRPEETLRAWLAVVDRVLVHAEEAAQWSAMAAGAEAAGVELGVALLLGTPLAVLEKLTPRPKFIQLMSIAEIGRQGYKLDERIFPRLAELRIKFPDAIIQVDGGVNQANFKKLLATGADNLISGSSYDSLRRQS